MASKASAFKANALQRRLFAEVMSGIGKGGKYLATKDHLVKIWLDKVKPTVTILASLGRAAVRQGRSDKVTMLADFGRAMRHVEIPDALGRLDDWQCLRELVGPDVLEELDTAACLANFRALASLDEGL